MTTNSAKEEQNLQLFSYHYSSCAFRVRIALNLKGIDYKYKSINLLKGEQHSSDFLTINPIGYVPALVDGDIVISDSFAIIMYLEERFPQHPLLPCDLGKRAINYQAASIVSASIQPMQNLDVLKYITENVGTDAKISWLEKKIGKGFEALEKLLKHHAGKYATGNDFFMADAFLGAQIYASINWFDIDMTPFPLLLGLYEAYMQLPAFQDALPEKQLDFTLI